MNPTETRARAARTLPYIAAGLYTCLTLLALLSDPAHGQANPGQQTTTQPLSVQGRSESEAFNPPGPEDARRAMERTPGGVTLVDEQQLHESHAATVKDALDYVPGVYAQTKYGSGDARINIRGSANSRNAHLRGVRLLTDGIPMNRADGGASDAQEIDPLVYRYAEVYKGANALQYGSSLLGGAVNFVSPTGHSWPGFLLRQGAGSEKSISTQLAWGGVSGAADYFISPTYRYTSGYRTHSDANIARLNANTGYRFNDSVETRFFMVANSISQMHPTGLTKAQALSNPESALGVNLTANTVRDVQSVRLANKTTFLTDSGEATAGFFTVGKELFHIFAATSVIDDHERVNGGFGRYRFDWQAGGFRNETTFGMNVTSGVLHAERFANLKGGRGALTDDTFEKSTSIEVYGEEQFYLRPSVALIAGAQGTYAERNLEDRFKTPADDSGSREYWGFSPKAGIRWDAAPGLQVFGNYSYSFEPPAFSELNPSTAAGFVALAPQRARTLEIGTRYRDSDHAAELAVYRAKVTDEIQVLDIGNSLNQSRNINATIHQGIEAGGETTLLRNALLDRDRLALRGAYTFSDLRFDDDPTFRDNQLPGLPRHYLRSELRYEHPDGWFVGPNVEWVPMSYFVDNVNRTTSPGYAILGLRGGWQVTPALRLFAEGRNLLDKHYITSVSVQSTATAASAIFNPGEGRMLFAGLEWRW